MYTEVFRHVRCRLASRRRRKASAPIVCMGPLYIHPSLGSHDRQAGHAGGERRMLMRICLFLIRPIELSSRSI